MKIATWNVNSIRARLDRVAAWLDQHRPDVLCMQETKVEDEEFPEEPFQLAGYRLAIHGQRTYNGVAIAARSALGDIVRGIDDGGTFDAEARAITATVAGIRVISAYVPNGKAVGDDKYRFKLAWLARLRRYLDDRCDPSQPLVLCGDFNIAPDDRDVHDPVAWQGKNLCSQPERDALAALRAWGLRDAFRELHPEPGFFSWWDYRMLGFQKNRGLRIDYHLVSDPVMTRVCGVAIDREARKGKQPSDHAPVVMTLSER
jgi:exodeoxyribonuclease-3